MPPVSGFQQPQALQEVSQPDTLRLVAAMLGHPLWRQSLPATQVAILVADIVAVATRHEEAGVSPASVNACAEGDEVGPFRVDLPATRCIGPVWNVGRESRRTGGCKAERADKECSRRETRVHMTHARSLHCCDCTRAGGGKSLMVAHRFCRSEWMHEAASGVCGKDHTRAARQRERYVRGRHASAAAKRHAYPIGSAGTCRLHPGVVRRWTDSFTGLAA